MIDVKELRIGNLVNHPEHDDVVVYGVSPDIIQYEEINGFSNKEVYYDEPEKFEPIRPTEEWLLRLGFTKVKNVGNELIFQGWCFELWLNDKNIYYENVLIEVDIEHVHQLQNLYFALTGEELTLKQ